MRKKRTFSTLLCHEFWPWPRPILEYVCVVVGLIEGRQIRLGEVVEMLERTVRQHRMVRARRIDQGVAWLNESPP